MLKKIAIFILVFTGLLAITTARPAYGTERVVKDRWGIPQGRIETKPDGTTVIKDNWGIPKGTIEPKPDGTLVIKDNWGIKRGVIQK